MKSFIAAITAASVLFPSLATPVAFTGTDMLRLCSVVAKNPGNTAVQGQDGMDAQACYSYVQGAMDAAHSLNGGGCAEGLGVVQAVLVYQKYLADHPELLHKTGTELLFDALSASFTCRWK